MRCPLTVAKTVETKNYFSVKQYCFIRLGFFVFHSYFRGSCYIFLKYKILSLLLVLGEDERERAFATVMAIFMGRHEDTGAAIFTWAFTAQAMNLTVFVNLRKRRRANQR